jgi:hypothetical protein
MALRKLLPPNVARVRGSANENDKTQTWIPRILDV